MNFKEFFRQFWISEPKLDEPEEYNEPLRLEPLDITHLALLKVQREVELKALSTQQRKEVEQLQLEHEDLIESAGRELKAVKLRHSKQRRALEATYDAVLKRYEPPEEGEEDRTPLIPTSGGRWRGL